MHLPTRWLATQRLTLPVALSWFTVPCTYNCLCLCFTFGREKVGEEGQTHEDMTWPSLSRLFAQLCTLQHQVPISLEPQYLMESGQQTTYFLPPSGSLIASRYGCFCFSPLRRMTSFPPHLLHGAACPGIFSYCDGCCAADDWVVCWLCLLALFQEVAGYAVASFPPSPAPKWIRVVFA